MKKISCEVEKWKAAMLRGLELRARSAGIDRAGLVRASLYLG